MLKDAVAAVDRNVAQLQGPERAELQADAVDLDRLLLGVDVHAQLVDGLRVDGDAAVADQILAVAAAAAAVLGQDLLETFAHGV